MSNDLISRSEALKWFSDHFDETDKVDNREIHEVLENFATAYDSDKVVEQLAQKADCNNECATTYYYGQGCKACLWGEMLAIVKGGGIDADK